MSIVSTEDYTDHGGMDLRPSQYAGAVDRVSGTHVPVCGGYYRDSGC